MPDKIIIKCPHCSVKLTIAALPAKMEKASITCPNCKHRSPLTAFIINNTQQPVVVEAEEGIAKTQSSRTSSSSPDETLPDLRPKKNHTIGSIILPDGSRVQLHLGTNTIGRRAQASLSEIQFPDLYNTKKASRHHARIEVLPQSNGQYLHTISNWENKNPTFVNGVRINEGDTIVLHDGDQILCGDVPLRFSTENHSEPLPQDITSDDTPISAPSAHNHA